MKQKQNRAKTFHVDMGEGHGLRKGMTVDVEGHPRAVVTRVKGNIVWAIPAPSAPVLTWIQRIVAIYQLIRYGRV